jgi:hypothetical protein
VLFLLAFKAIFVKILAEMRLKNLIDYIVGVSEKGREKE